MGIFRGPEVYTNGIALCIDGANHKCYPGTGTTATSIGRLNANGSTPTADINGTATWSDSVNTYGRGSWELDGNSDWLEITGRPDGFRPTQTEMNASGYTVTMWVLPNNTIANQGLFCSDGATLNTFYGHECYTDSLGFLSMRVGDGTGSSTSDERRNFTTIEKLIPNQWQHLSFAFGDGTPSKMGIAINGVAGNMGPGLGTGGDVAYSTSLNGGLGLVRNSYFDGRFGGVWVWKDTPALNDIKDHYIRTKDKYNDPI